MLKDKISTSQKILNYIQKKGQVSGRELVDYLGNISDRAVRKQLKNLHDKGLLKKIGKPPKVFFTLSLSNEKLDDIEIDQKIRSVIDKRYIYISPTGQLIPGWQGFVIWCKKTSQKPVKTAREYIQTLKKYDKFRKNDFINGMKKMKDTFNQVYLDKVYYLDFYSIERFGKTKLGQMLLYAKQSQSRKLINDLVSEIKQEIQVFIKKNNISAVLFVPPTVKREIQFMKEFEKKLNLKLPIIKITKVRTPIIIPQKTLSKLQDRITNVAETVVVEEVRNFNNILIIDDAVGSGATMNEIAKQLRKKEICTEKIYGIAVTGSFKGFDVISEI